VRFLTTANAREAPFDCDRWSKLRTNASREAVSAGGFQHDSYEATLGGDFESAVDLLYAYMVLNNGVQMPVLGFGVFQVTASEG